MPGQGITALFAAYDRYLETNGTNADRAFIDHIRQMWQSGNGLAASRFLALAWRSFTGTEGEEGTGVGIDDPNYVMPPELQSLVSDLAEGFGVDVETFTTDDPSVLTQFSTGPRLRETDAPPEDPTGADDEAAAAPSGSADITGRQVQELMDRLPQEGIQFSTPVGRKFHRRLLEQFGTFDDVLTYLRTFEADGVVNVISVVDDLKTLTPPTLEDSPGGPGDTTTEDSILTDPDPAADPVGSDETHPGVLGGGELIQVRDPDGDDLFLMVFEDPPGSGRYVAWQFDDAEQVAATFGPDYQLQAREETLDWMRESVTILDSAAEIIGMSGTYQQMKDEALAQIAEAAGITDPTILGQFIADPGIQDIMFKAAQGNWSAERIRAAIRNESFYTDVLYPGIEQFYARGSSTPEADWATYAQNMTAALEFMGAARDSDGSYRTTIGELLRDGTSDTKALEWAPVFVRASQSPEYYKALSRRAGMTGRTLSFDDWFDVLNGNTPGDLSTIVEEATLDFQAQQQGARLIPGEIERIASLSNMTEAQMAQAFGRFVDDLLVLGDDILRGADVERAELLALRTGTESPTGRSLSEIARKATSLIIERGLRTQDKARPFTGFSQRGIPERPGFSPLTPEGA